MPVVTGVDLGGTSINYTLLNHEEKFLIEGLSEHPALAKQGPEICLQQIADGLKIVTPNAGISLGDMSLLDLILPGRPVPRASLVCGGRPTLCMQTGRDSISAQGWRTNWGSPCRT